ncbi:putative membrane protein required for colicin V production [Staphylococcus hominis]
MIVDLVLILMILIYMVIGFRRGLWLNSLHLSSTLVSLFIAYRYYRDITKQMIVFVPFPKTVAFDTHFAFQYHDVQQRFDTIVAFLCIAFLSKLLLYLIIVTFDNIVSYHNIHFASRVFGSLLGIIASMIVLQLVLYLVSLYPNEWIQENLKDGYLSHIILFKMPFLSSYILNL